ncbi:MAG: hypothetical protein ACXWT0_01585 [Methylobacter sp.]
MPDRQLVNEHWFWTDKLMWSVVAMFILGSMARTFISNDPFEPRKCIGEIIFSAIGAVMMYSMGLMQGMSQVQIVCFGALAALGGVRLFEWVMKIAKTVKRSGLIDE